ncbi:MAG: hypothetical protein ACYSW4_04555 [Planctomycetota bacterium]|jgi:hypothetical protein
MSNSPDIFEWLRLAGDWVGENWERLLHILWYIWSGYWWLIVGGTLVVAVVIMVFSRFERQPIRLLEPTKEPELDRQNPYTRAMNEMAAKLGFRQCGWFADRRRSFVYGATVTMWLSPDALTLALVNGGKMAGLKVEQTVLVSKPIGGRVLTTTDMTSDPDISGTLEQQELLNADMAELCELHKGRLKEWAGKLKPFRASSLLDECEGYERRQAEVMVDYGLAKWVEPGRKQWRYTIRGAILRCRAYRNDWKAMKKQPDRWGKKRPGETLPQETR